jgi:PDZ domain-containing protein
VDDVPTDVDVEVVSAENPSKAGSPYVGVSVGNLTQGEFPVDFTLQDVGGPSAGLMLSLGIVDKLTPEDLAQGRHFAGTGTIDADGNVGPIGGIRQKLAGARAAGAELFLMPAQHCVEAEGHVPDGLTVVPVERLSDAVTAVQSWTAGGAVEACSPTVS